MNGVKRIKKTPRKTIKLKKGVFKYLSTIAHCLPYDFKSNIKCMVKKCNGRLLPYYERQGTILLYCDTCKQEYFGGGNRIVSLDIIKPTTNNEI